MRAASSSSLSGVLRGAGRSRGARRGGRAPWQRGRRRRTGCSKRRPSCCSTAGAARRRGRERAQGLRRRAAARARRRPIPPLTAHRAALARRAAPCARATRWRSPPRAARSRRALPGAYAVDARPRPRGDAATASRWLLLREFRTATRFTRPGRGRDAGRRAARGPASSAAEATPAVRKDLLDAYQARLRELLDEAAPRRRARPSPRAAPRPPRRPRATSPILGGALRGGPRRRRHRAGRPRLRGAAQRPPGDPGCRRARPRGGSRWTASPPRRSPRRARPPRRAQQLLRFLDLVPVEYGRGIKDDQCHLDFEIQEAVAFRTGAESALRRPARPAREARRDPHRGRRGRR